MYEQLSLFDDENNEFSINKPIRLIELFAGMGTQAQALKHLGVPFESHFVCEFDKYAMAAYNAVHGTNYEVSDVRKITGTDLNIENTDKYCYIMTYSFPCTDLSIAGKCAGMSKKQWENGESTRSGLLWEVERLLKECKDLEKKSTNSEKKFGIPQVLLMENVTQVHAAKNMNDFSLWLQFLNSLGYSNFYHDMNAKEYGVAQNRNRCFMVSLLGDYTFKFPETIPLNKTMENYLDKEVDEKYFINSEKADKLIEDLIQRGVLPE